jgi:hypothetical protein
MNEGEYDTFIYTCSIGGIELVAILLKKCGVKTLKKQLLEFLSACCDWLNNHSDDDEKDDYDKLINTYCRLTKLRLMEFHSVADNMASVVPLTPV